MLKKMPKYLLRLFIGIFILLTLLLFVTGVIFMIPSVQTKTAQKVAEAAKVIQRERDRIFDEMIMTVQHMGDDFNRMV